MLLAKKRMQSLKETLVQFRDLVNQKAPLKKFLKGWEPCIHVETIDQKQQYTLLIRNCVLQEIQDGLAAHNDPITVRGNQDVLAQIFEGKLDAAQALIEGQIEIYGREKDMIKLDALTLVLWEV